MAWFENNLMKDKWCCYGERHRTTNKLEGWHAMLNRTLVQNDSRPKYRNAPYLLPSNAFDISQGNASALQKPLCRRMHSHKISALLHYMSIILGKVPEQ
ncbi:hypothetical protein HW555_010546 [Spodoptera exigua]|uniref:Uncharacterized protein n=1 Tax=Spodoptera exigua TaxID=7107 RepID=A0A835L1F6_SPOEX|nr:hypothetical protein HW555_010546 [Spodoptera exigua]